MAESTPQAPTPTPEDLKKIEQIETWCQEFGGTYGPSMGQSQKASLRKAYTGMNRLKAWVHSECAKAPNVDIILFGGNAGGEEDEGTI